jgi:hypothetical protein
MNVGIGRLDEHGNPVIVPIGSLTPISGDSVKTAIKLEDSPSPKPI